MRHAVAVMIATTACVASAADQDPIEMRIFEAEAVRIVQRHFAPVCGSEARFRCPLGIEDRAKRNCPFEAIVLLPLGPNGTYDGRSQPVWISLSERGSVLAVSFDKANVCPLI